ncbi:MAG TPA: hypothetical protein VLX61_00555 [Anaerolineales bacterium]|nr:hypothetical protein [Anaerolineales bacterium]
MTTAAISKEAKSEIAWYDYKMWPSGTRAIVASVLFAVCFTATMQITERIDTALDGGVLDILGGTFRNVWYWPAVIYFGLTGGLIAANFNPIIAVLTATGPLAPAWFFVNTAHVVPAAFLAQNAFEKRRATKEGISLGYFLVNMVIPAHFFSLLPLVPVWLFVFKLPILFAVGLFLLGWFTSIPGGYIGFHLCRSIGRSGLV